MALCISKNVTKTITCMNVLAFELLWVCVLLKQLSSNVTDEIHIWWQMYFAF